MKFGNLFAGSALIKRTLALCIALVLLGSLFVSAYAAELTEEIQPPEEEPAAAVLTYVFLVNGAQYRCVTVGSGETLTRPDDPVLDGHSFAGWFTADGMEFTGFGTVAAFEASATVELYGRFVAAEVPAVSEEPPAPQSPVIGEDNEEEPEDKQPAEEPKPEDGGDEAGIENENEEEESAEAPQCLSATASLPVIVYAEKHGCSREQMLRALALSDLIAIHLKSGIGRLSAYCGAVCAATGAGCAMTYLDGGTLEQIDQTITNSIATSSGMVCDGAKPSCAAKIATSLESAIMAHDLAMANRAFQSGEGIVMDNVEQTIDAVGCVASRGMHITDQVILNLMTQQKGARA